MIGAVLPGAVAAAGGGGAFISVSDAALSTQIESNVMTITAAQAGPITITGGQYRKNGGSYTSSSGTVAAGDTVQLRVTSSGSNGTGVTATATINGVAYAFTVTTVAAATPTLTLSASTFTAGATSGTLIGNIGNVPSGSTPTFAPNDGRVAIAGDEATGWKLVVGLSASTAGTISGTISASGANSLPVTLTVAAAGAGTPLVNTDPWRVPILEATDTVVDSTSIVTDLLAAHTTLYRLRAPTTANVTRTIIVRIGPLARRGFVHFTQSIANPATFPVKVSESFAFTNMTDGVFNEITFEPFPSTASSIKADKPNIVWLEPSATPRLVKIDLNHTASVTLAELAFHELPATGRAQLINVHGASLTSGLMPRLAQACREDAPGADPVFIDWAVPATGPDSFDPAYALSRVPEAPYVMFDAVGNGMTMPYSAAPATGAGSVAKYRADFRAAIDAYVAAGKAPILTRCTFRFAPDGAPAIDPNTPNVNEDQGSMPWNTYVIDPIIQEYAPWSFDSFGYGIADCDYYSAAKLWRRESTDGRHLGRYTILHREFVRSIWRKVTGQSANAQTFSDWFVDNFRDYPTAWYTDQFQYLTPQLPASAAKTALAARIASLAPRKRAVCNLSTITVPASGRTLNVNECGVSGTTALIDTAGAPTGWSVTIGAGWAHSTTGDPPSTTLPELNPKWADAELDGSMYSSANAVRTVVFSGLEAGLYTVELACATKTQLSIDGVTKVGAAPNPSAITNGLLDGIQFTGVSPTAGGITLTFPNLGLTAFRNVQAISIVKQAA